MSPLQKVGWLPNRRACVAVSVRCALAGPSLTTYFAVSCGGVSCPPSGGSTIPKSISQKHVGSSGLGPERSSVRSYHVVLAPATLSEPAMFTVWVPRVRG